MLARAKIGLIVEGDGELDAAPTLLVRALQHLGRHDAFCGLTQNAGGRFKLTRAQGLEKFVERAYREPNDAALLILIDSEGECPATLARALAARIETHGARRPTAVVVAHRMYEAWFVACGPALVGRALPSRPAFGAGLAVAGNDGESVRDAKAHLNQQLPRERPYKETQDQKTLTRWLDLEMAASNSRSFRRFLDAVSQLLDAIDNQTRDVTPRP